MVQADEQILLNSHFLEYHFNNKADIIISNRVVPRSDSVSYNEIFIVRDFLYMEGSNE
jgi:hypothetical protein